MSVTWKSDAPPPVTPPISLTGWGLVVARGIPLATLVFGGLLILLVLRLFERPVFGMARPVTPYVTVFVCRNALRIMGIGLKSSGRPMRGQGGVVANHSSWLDIFVLNAHGRVYFVSKSEVAAWPGIGWLARATGTVFIERNRAKAAEQSATFETRLNAGHQLLFFPEGTSSDGQRVLPFKSSLFAAFFAPQLRDVLMLQPVSLTYQAPEGADPRFYAWWGDMAFGPHLVRLLARGKQGGVTVAYATPIKVRDHANRKTLAQACEAEVRAGHTM